MSITSIQAEAERSRRESRERHDNLQQWTVKHRFRLLMFGLLAVPAVGLLTWQLLISDVLNGWLLLGAFLLLPLLVELGNRP